MASYGQIALLAGNPRGARQVSRILHSCSDRYDLPWHRVINAAGRISLTGDGKALQQALLESEGVRFQRDGSLDLTRWGWRPPAIKEPSCLPPGPIRRPGRTPAKE